MLRAATDKIMTDVAALLGELRDEVPPAKPYHPAVARRKFRQDMRALSEASSETESPADSATPGADSLVKAAVMGAGSWGTTFAQVLCDAGTPTTIWCRRPELAEAINGRPPEPRLPAGHRAPARL